MKTFQIEHGYGDTVAIGFGEPATNDVIVREVHEYLAANKLAGGPLVKFDGPASLPVAFVLAHAVAHLYGTVAVKDPKLGKFVVVITHGGQHRVGDVIE